MTGSDEQVAGGAGLLTIAQVETPAEIRTVQELLREYTTWVMTLAEGSEDAPTFQGLERELATLPGVYAPPDGRLLLATHDGHTVGCVALRRHDAETGEIKRLYVRPGFRGLRIGQRLVATVMDAAREVGYRRLVLDSHASMTKAHEIYEAVGFRRTSAPPDFPKGLEEVVIFMEMTL